jgi:hypothetical protein
MKFMHKITLENMHLLHKTTLENMQLVHKNNLFFWIREQKNSSAEVDYLIAVGSSILPVEVKAGSIGSLRSLRYLISEIPRLVRSSKFGEKNGND